MDGAIEFVVLTLWESMEAVRRFAGDEPEKAVVEPQAQAVLTSFDNSVTHFEIIDRTDETAAGSPFASDSAARSENNH